MITVFTAREHAACRCLAQIRRSQITMGCTTYSGQAPAAAARCLDTRDPSPPSKLKSLGCSLQCCKSIMSGNYPSSALRHGQQVKPQVQLIGRQAVANIIRGKYLLRYWNYSCQIDDCCIEDRSGCKVYNILFTDVVTSCTAEVFRTIYSL